MVNLFNQIISYIDVYSNIFSIILAFLTIVVTCVIGWIQIKQNKTLDKSKGKKDKEIKKIKEKKIKEKVYKKIEDSNKTMLELQEKRDKYVELRHKDYIESLAYTFINENIEDKEFIPLCLIASMYDRGYNYRRPIYRKFCVCTLEVQNKILELCNVNLKVEKIDNFFLTCIKSVNDVINKNNMFLDSFGNTYTESIYYDGGKYLENLLLYYGNEVQGYFAKERERITDVLSNFFRTKNIEYPINTLCNEFDFYNNADEKKVGLFAANIAKWVMFYNTQKQYGFNVPIMNESRIDIYCEDVFLEALLKIYYQLVFKEDLIGEN